MKKTLTAIALATALSMTSTSARADRVNQLSDERVRQAIAYAIDMDTIVETLFEGKAIVADSMIPNGGFKAEGLNAYSYDPDRARELLAAVPDMYAERFQHAVAKHQGTDHILGDYEGSFGASVRDLKNVLLAAASDPASSELDGTRTGKLDEAFDKFGKALDRARGDYDDIKESESILSEIVDG